MTNLNNLLSGMGNDVIFACCLALVQMSRCSSESDVTLSLQDSPEPPPHLRPKSANGHGLDNPGYVSPSKDEKHHTSLLAETPMNSNIVNLIPTKPSPQLGPFEPLSDYFIPINHHKKFFRWVTRSTYTYPISVPTYLAICNLVWTGEVRSCT